MKIFRNNSKSVVLRLSPDEAGNVLMGMEDSTDALGAPARALADALRRADVQRPAPQPIRTEYMPPLH